MQKDAGAELRKGLEEFRKDFYKRVDGINKRLKKYDDGKEAQFFQQYKIAEVEKRKKDEETRRMNHLNYEKKLSRGSVPGGYMKPIDDSHSNSAMRSGKSLGVGPSRRKRTADPSSVKAKIDKQNIDGYINKEIDYFGRCELVETASKAMNYTPLALRD